MAPLSCTSTVTIATQTGDILVCGGLQWLHLTVVRFQFYSVGVQTMECHLP